MKIKSFIVFAITLPVLILINRCEDEKAVSRDYPRLNTFPVTNISDSGALVTGEIYAQGTQEILEYGFVWGKSELLIYGSNDMVILGTPQSTGAFTAFISSALAKGTTYWVRPFARTTECIVYGKAISFTSLGSLAPVINGFYPDSAGWGDTITIRGKRLSWVPNKNIVKLNGITCYATRSTDTSVVVYVPNSLSIRESLLTVGIEGNTSTFNGKKFRLILPELTDFNPKQARWGDTVLITGKRLGTVNYSGNSVKFGTSNCTFVRVKEDSVWIKVPSDINSINNILNLSINGIPLSSGQSFQLLEPYFTFTPAEGTWGSRITLSGRFNAISSRNSFYVNNIQAAVVSSNATKAEIIVPAALSSAESQINYKATPFEINSVNKFVLLPPQLTSFSPSFGSYNQLVTINGDRFGTVNTPVVKFGNIQASVSSWTNTQIKAYVPNTGYGPVKISVTIGSQSVESSSDFTMKNSRIISISPESGTFNDLVTITGENFNPNAMFVQFGDINATIKSFNSSTVVVEVPISLDSIPRNIKVSDWNVYAISDQKFTLLPPEIHSISPLSTNPGDEITITGNNFNPDLSKNSISLDLVKYKIKSSTKSQIVAIVPDALPRGSFKLKLRTGGFTRQSSNEFNVNSGFLRIQSPLIKTNNYRELPIASFSTQNYVYLTSLSGSGITYKFDPTLHQWTFMNSVPELGNGYSSFSRYASIQNSLFLVYGDYNPVFSAFNSTEERWKRVNLSLPENSEALIVSINNKLYYNASTWIPQNSAWYEIDPALNFSMVQKAKFPATLYSSQTASFSLNNYGYILFGNNNFYRYDPVNDSWLKLADFPGARRWGAVSFVLNNKAYVGTGRDVNYKELNDIWRYDSVNDSWVKVASMPNARAYATAFSFNGKAYIGYGSQNRSDLNDLYEYDPNY